MAMFLFRRPVATQLVYKRALLLFCQHVKVDIDNLHEYLEKTDREILFENLLTFGETLKRLAPNSQRSMLSSVMSYFSYNDIAFGKGQIGQILPRKGCLARDKAFTKEDVKKVYQHLSLIGRAALLILWSTGMRIGELIRVTEDDIQGKTIHIRAVVGIGGEERIVVMTNECRDFIYNVWLPQKNEYLKSAHHRNDGLLKAGVSRKNITDPRVVPINMPTCYKMLMLAFKKAGFTQRIGKKYLYHPHSLRKSFRTIVGSKDVDLAEVLMGHEGYMTSAYLRIEEAERAYVEVAEPLLTLFGGVSDNTLTEQVALLQRRLDILEATAHPL